MSKDDVEVIGSFSPSGEIAPLKKGPFWKKPVFIKGLVAGILLAGFALFFVHEKKSGVSPAGSVVPAPSLPPDATGVSKNPEYQKKISILNKNQTEIAVRTGQSIVPTVGGDSQAGDINKIPEPSPPPVPSTPPPRVSGDSVSQAERRKAYDAAKTEEMASVSKEFDGVLASWSSQGSNLAILAAPKEAVQTGSPSKGNPGKSSGKAGSAKGVGKGIPIIPAGRILYGRIINELNSDRPGPVLAEAVGGQFDGVKFLGSFQRDNGALVIKFDRVIYPDGETDSIGAYAVSPGAKLRSGLETDVNNHYLYRYGSLLASAFMQGFGQAAMYANSTSYPSAMGTPVIGFNGMTLMQQTEMGIGQAGMMLGGQAMNAFNTPPTVKVAANSPVGLMIVAETGQKMPKESSSAGNTQAKSGLVNAPGPSMVPQPGYPQPMMGGGYPGYGGGYGGGYGMPMMPMMP